MQVAKTKLTYLLFCRGKDCVLYVFVLQFFKQEDNHTSFDFSCHFFFVQVLNIMRKLPPLFNAMFLCYQLKELFYPPFFNVEHYDISCVYSKSTRPKLRPPRYYDNICSFILYCKSIMRPPHY